MEPRPNGNRSGIKAIAITFVIIQRHSQATVKNPSYQGLQALTCYQYHKLSILDFLVSHPPHQIIVTPLRTGLPGLLSIRKRDKLCGRYGCGPYRRFPNCLHVDVAIRWSLKNLDFRHFNSLDERTVGEWISFFHLMTATKLKVHPSNFGNERHKENICFGANLAF